MLIFESIQNLPNEVERKTFISRVPFPYSLTAVSHTHTPLRSSPLTLTLTLTRRSRDTQLDIRDN
jgi:hypothetical protein